MAVLVHSQGAAWNQELYQTIFDRVIPDRANPPAGLIIHTGMPGDGGGWEVVDVWESQAAFQRFTEDVIMPAAQELGAPPFDTRVVEIYNLLVT
ncbi:hypothetical protein [Streptomyces sp. NBC_00091]|uniref:hypothetical protein n=1 Tax=Streptomyces sp. NBC_00091 TaxID=2975648 RepID=UPI00225A6C5C|nr:hypothetical protein [Streptomyces sp. NBC_00091]MCX5376221.1 hypothetical protein [Streptomyces sp. NBC_00091]